MEYYTDILVVGGGMAGFSAAYSASKLGARVMLVDKSTSLGGLATRGLVMPMMGVYGGGKKVISGVLDEIVEGMKKYFPNSIEGYYFDPEIMKYCLEKLIDELEIKLLYDTVAIDVISNNRMISEVKVANKSGISNIKAKYVIDTTGDADIAYMSKVKIKIGRDEDSKTQAYTLRFILGNVDVEKANKHLSILDKEGLIEKLFLKYSNKYNLPIMDNGLQHFLVPGRENSLAFNVPRLLDVNGVDAQSLTNGYVLGRKLIDIYSLLIRENVNGCSKALVTNTAECLGVRESRRIEGEYTITKQDVVDGRKFYDAVASCAWWIDIHNPNGRGVSSMIKPKGGYYDIPYRSLITRKYDNLLVAGRCISADHESLASARIMPTCIATGQAAGSGAYRALIEGLSVSKIDIDKLRQTLASNGASITGINLL